VAGALAASEAPKVLAEFPKRVEAAVPELKGKVLPAPRPVPAGDATNPSPLLAESGRKVFVATAKPDPLYGIVDARVQACLCLLQGAQRELAGSRREYEPAPFAKTTSYEKAEEMSRAFREASFLTLVPRGGRVRSVLQDAPFDAVRNAFLDAQVSPAKGLIVGAGGRGYDDTLSSALRAVWGALAGVRKSGEVLIVAECSGGLGSVALEMFVQGRMGGEGTPRKEKYVDGQEELFYLGKLRDEYDLLLLSGLPELFAKGKLGLNTARGSGEAVGRLLNKLGRTARVNLVTRAAELRVTQA
jgi:hypothetical protein